MMPTITRILLTIHLPVDLGVLSATLKAVIDAYPNAVQLDQPGADRDVVRVVVVEDVDDAELARRGLSFTPLLDEAMFDPGL